MRQCWMGCPSKKKWIWDEIYVARSNKPVCIDPIDRTKFPFGWNLKQPKDGIELFQKKKKKWRRAVAESGSELNGAVWSGQQKQLVESV